MAMIYTTYLSQSVDDIICQRTKRCCLHGRLKYRSSQPTFPAYATPAPEQAKPAAVSTTTATVTAAAPKLNTQAQQKKLPQVAKA